MNIIEQFNSGDQATQLRGGGFATPARSMRNTWRDLHAPKRYEFSAGFRTCAIGI